MDLGRGLRTALAKITGAALVDEKAVREFLREIQRVLIASDVPVKLVFTLTKNIERTVLAEDAAKGLSLREQVVRATYDELVALVGDRHDPSLKPRRILLLGLYGSGKTTTCGKLSAFYKSRGLSVAVVACDTDRPAAYEQLEQLASKTGAHFLGIKGEPDVRRIVQASLPQVKEDLVVVDSAGRSGFDEELVAQLKAIDAEVQPQERILVMSADIGQVAGRQAAQFHEAVGLTGVILTKLDGSGKGGGALAACQEAKVPVLFVGTGEKMEDLEVYDPKKFVGRLLGMPDFAALMERVQKVAEEEKLAQADMEKLTLGGFYQQLKAARKMGPLSSVFGMMGMADLPADALNTSEKKLKSFEAVISSMTKEERDDAMLFKKSKARVERVARGSGRSEGEVRELLTQFDRISGMMDGFKKNRGMRKKLEKMLGKSGMDMSKLQGMMGGQGK